MATDHSKPGEGSYPRKKRKFSPIRWNPDGKQPPKEAAPRLGEAAQESNSLKDPKTNSTRTISPNIVSTDEARAETGEVTPGQALVEELTGCDTIAPEPPASASQDKHQHELMLATEATDPRPGERRDVRPPALDSGEAGPGLTHVPLEDRNPEGNSSEEHKQDSSKGSDLLEALRKKVLQSKKKRHEALTQSAVDAEAPQRGERGQREAPPSPPTNHRVMVTVKPQGEGGSSETFRQVLVQCLPEHSDDTPHRAQAASAARLSSRSLPSSVSSPTEGPAEEVAKGAVGGRRNAEEGEELSPEERGMGRQEKQQGSDEEGVELRERESVESDECSGAELKGGDEEEDYERELNRREREELEREEGDGEPMEIDEEGERQREEGDSQERGDEEVRIGERKSEGEGKRGDITAGVREEEDEDEEVVEDEEEEEEDEDEDDENRGLTLAQAGLFNPMLRGCRSVDNFERLNRIAEGTYGVVYRARDKRTGEIVALKKVKMDQEKEGFPLTSLREINLLLSLVHPNIVEVREVVVGSSVDSVFMVMEYMEHDLRSVMEAMRQPFSTSEVKCLMQQLLRGLAHLHHNWVLHRDLKTSNLLLSNKGELKVCDFGMAREYGSPLKVYSHMVVTLWYRAPELLLGVSKYSTGIDMWSAGCVLGELLTGDPLFQGKTEIEQLDKIFKTLGTPTEKVWPEFSQLPNARRVNFVKQPLPPPSHPSLFALLWVLISFVFFLLPFPPLSLRLAFRFCPPPPSCVWPSPPLSI